MQVGFLRVQVSVSPHQSLVSSAGSRKPALPLEYFQEYERGLARTTIYRDVAVSWLGSIRSEAIIPELADVLLRIEGVKWSLCMGISDEDLLILSMRSTARSKDAGKVLRRLVGKSGSAGGHRQMAGGQVPLVGMTNEDRGRTAKETR